MSTWKYEGRCWERRTWSGKGSLKRTYLLNASTKWMKDSFVMILAKHSTHVKGRQALVLMEHIHSLVGVRFTRFLRKSSFGSWELHECYRTWLNEAGNCQLPSWRESPLGHTLVAASREFQHIVLWDLSVSGWLLSLKKWDIRVPRADAEHKNSSDVNSCIWDEQVQQE